MPFKIKWELCCAMPIIILLILIIISNNFVESGKNSGRKGKKAKNEIGNLEENQNANNGIEITQSIGESTTLEDVESKEMAANFKEFLLATDGASKEVEQKVWTNSLIWFLKRKIGELLHFARNLGSELAEMSEKFVSEWQKMFDSIAKEQTKRTICVMYHFAVELVKCSLIHSQFMPKLGKYLRDERILEIVKLENVDCTTEEEIERIFDSLLSPTRMQPINGQNLLKLLQDDEQFRNFFAYEVNLYDVKPELNMLTNNEYMILMENEFPGILRIDIMLTSTLFERFKWLLMNRSGSEQYRANYTRLTMGALMRMLVNVEARIEKQGVHLSGSVKKALRGKVHSVCCEAYEDLLSEVQMCVLIKLGWFIGGSATTKNVHKFNEKVLKRWRADECRNEAEWATVAKELREGGELVKLYKEVAEQAMHYSPEHFRTLLTKTPGAKTRFLRLMANRSDRARVLEEIVAQLHLESVFAEDVFADADLLWKHYKVFLQNIDPIWHQSSKLGAHIIVFLKWLKTEIDRRNLKASLFQRIRDVIADEIYDPLFDEQQAELTESEQVLANIFGRTKQFLEKIGAKNGGQSFKKWQETVNKIGILEEKEMEEVKQLIQKIHRSEFAEQLRDAERMENFMEILRCIGVDLIREYLLQLFDNDAITGLFLEFGIDVNDFGKPKPKDEEIEANASEKMNQQNTTVKQKEKSDGIEKSDQQMMSQNNNGENCAKIGEQITENDDDYWHIECPPAYVPIEELQAIDRANNQDAFARSAFRVFLEYLASDDKSLAQSTKRSNALDLELHGVLWYLLSLADNLLEFAINCEPKETIFHKMVQQIKKIYEKLLEGVQSNREKQFRLAEFITFLLNNKTLWENSKSWQCRLLAEHLISSDELKLTDQWVKQAYDELNNAHFHSTITGDGKNEYMNFFCISQLINQFKEMQRFFCDLRGANSIVMAKSKLEALIGIEYIIELDEMFPEIMQIDVPIPMTQAVLYEHFLQQKTRTDAEMISGARLAMPILLQRLNQIIRSAVPAVMRRRIAGAFRDKLKQVQHQSYRGLRRELLAIGVVQPIGAALLRSLCIVHKFTDYTLKSIALYKKANQAIREEAIRSWTWEGKCETGTEWAKAYHREQRIELVSIHRKDVKMFLLAKIGTLRQCLRENRGARTRLKKLIGQIGYNDIMQEFGKELKDPNVFNDARLMQDYLDALFDLDKETRVVGNLSVFIAIWIRWMEQQMRMDTLNRTTAFHSVESDWKRIRAYFEELYDELVDVENFYELEQKSYLLRVLLKRIRDFVEVVAEKSGNNENKGEDIQRIHGGHLMEGRHREPGYRKREETNGKMVTIKWHKLVPEWDRIVTEVQQQAKEMQMVEEEADYYEQWIDGLHWETLIRLVGNNKTFREQLTKGFESDQNDKCKWRLKDFISWPMVEEFIGILKVANNEREFETKISVLRGKKEWKDKESEEEAEIKRKREEDEEANQKADQRMKELIREEERIKELKQRMQHRQAEKRRRQKEREREMRGREREEREESGEREEKAEEDDRENEEEESEEATNSEFWDDNFGGIGTPSKSSSKRAKKKKICKEGSNGNGGTNERPSAAGQQLAKGTSEQLLNELTTIKLNDFIFDEFLNSKYEEFVGNPSDDAKRKLLDIGVYVNEIGHRMEIIEQFNEQINRKNGKFGAEIGIHRSQKLLLAIGEEWKNWTKSGIQIGNEVELLNIQLKLQGMLKQIIFIMEGRNWEEQNANLENDLKITVQLHRNKLAKAIVLDGEGKLSIWHKIGEKEQNNVLSALFGQKEAKTNLVSRFRELIESWRNLMDQQHIDQNLYEQFARHVVVVQQAMRSMGMGEMVIKYPEYTQQIYYQCNDEHRQEELFFGLINEYTQESKTAETVLNRINGIVSKWSDGMARLVVTGSYLFGVSNSDIDTICIVPQRKSKREEKEQFYGTHNCDLGQSVEGRFCEDNSLYCQFCKNLDVQSLHKIPFAYIPLIQVNFAGIDFDVMFVSIPEIECLPDEPLDAMDIEWMMEVLANQSEPPEPEAMLKSLSSYLANNQIKITLTEKNLAKFRHLLLLLKHWAKINDIYGNVFGFLNGISLSVLASKIILWYPNATLPFLFEKFLLIFMEWNWPMPVKLIKENGIGIFDRLSWHPSEDDASLIMPIITPSNLAQNCAFNINSSTFQIIQIKMRKTFSELRRIQNLPENSYEEWKKLFSFKNFAEKYRHFVVISCVVSAQQHIEQFCGFVERRIKTQLLSIDQLMGNTVEYSHVKPDKNLAKNNKCPEIPRIHSTHSRAPYCKVWLVGLRLKDEQVGANVLGMPLKNQINEVFNREFDTKIYKEYDVKVLRGWYQHIKLESTYVGRAELTKWNLN